MTWRRTLALFLAWKGVLQFVANRRHDVPIGLTSVHHHPQDSVFGRRCDIQRQAGADAVPTGALFHIDNSVGRLDACDETAERVGALRRFLDQRANVRMT